MKRNKLHTGEKETHGVVVVRVKETGGGKMVSLSACEGRGVRGMMEFVFSGGYLVGLLFHINPSQCIEYMVSKLI